MPTKNDANSLTESINNSWYRISPWLILLLPLSTIYAALSGLRRCCYKVGLFKSYRAKVPVIIVGNISVGGTGKTPLVIALIEQLRAAGFRPAVISRGYGSKAPVYPYLVTAKSPAAHSGDEPLLIVKRTGVPLVISSNRKAAIEDLRNYYHCNVIISDDGLQHYALKRDYEIAVIDGSRGFGNGFLMPAGPLREGVKRLISVDHVVINGEQKQNLQLAMADHKSSVMSLKPAALRHVNQDKSIAINQWGDNKRVHAIAGIGNPQRFFNTLTELGFEPIPHCFPDHHQFSEDDCQFGDDLAVIMTEKDAVKMAAFKHIDHCWYLPVDADIEGELFADVIHFLKHTQIASKKIP